MESHEPGFGMPDPLPAEADPRTGHVCWVCGGTRTRKTDGLWYAIWRMFRSGNLTLWLCSKYCHEAATVLVDGLVRLPPPPGYAPLL